jgi:Dyp-type peroxidase family
LRLPREGAVVTDRARAALRAVAEKVTAARWEDDRSKRDKTAVNIAFTCEGIAALGHTAATLGSFPPEFQSGMTTDYRARALGDIKANDPSHWEYFGTAEGGSGAPNAAKRPDVLLLCFADSSAALDDTVAAVLKPFKTARATVIAEERGCPDMHNSQEHFGFRDSITSVKIAGGFGVKDPGQSVVAPGEFILGYENEYGQLTPSPILYPAPGAPGGDLGKNGAYLVFRKLRQDVPEFWNYCRAQARNLGPAAADVDEPSTLEFVAAKMVGRWRNGTPLTLSPFRHDDAVARDPSKINDFSYATEDADGSRCPFGAHIRRANPRDVLSTLGPDESRDTVNHHRILRRGRAYGKPLQDPTRDKEDGVNRGLLFFCINADIARQFEFVQQTWMTEPKFAGLWNEPDPLIGSVDNLKDPGEEGAEFTIPQKTLRLRMQNVPRVVTVRAGGYLFLPGISRLNTIIDPPAS